MPGYRTGYLKMRLREAIDFAVTALAYAYKEEDGVIVDARLVAGGIAPVPRAADCRGAGARGQEAHSRAGGRGFQGGHEGRLPHDGKQL